MSIPTAEHLRAIHALLALEVQYPAIREVIEDTKSKRSIFDPLDAAGISRIEKAGFLFNTTTVVDRRNELKEFVSEHPALESKTLDGFLERLKIFFDSIVYLNDSPCELTQDELERIADPAYGEDKMFLKVEWKKGKMLVKRIKKVADKEEDDEFYPDYE